MIMNNLNSLPDDIWRCIAALLPRDELLPLASINRAFLAIALDERYRVVRWEKLDESTTRRLERLRIPRIAGRVRHLHVRAQFIQRLAPDAENGTGPSTGPISRMAQWFHYLFPTTYSRSLPARSDMLAAMTEAVQLMTNAVECSFELTASSLTPETIHFLTAARAALGTRFRKLKLSARLKDFAPLLAAVDFIDNLDELDLTFDYDLDDDPSTTGPSASLIQTTIAPFIARFSHSLRALSISAISKIDISPLLDGLPVFARLEKLAVRLTCGFLDATALMSVLHAHTDTLTALEISTSCQATAFAMWRALAEKPCRRLLDGLQSLILGYESHVFECVRDSNPSSSSAAPTAMPFRPFAESDNLWEPQLETVLKTLSALPIQSSSNMHTKLRIGVFDLTPRVFALLARYLPHLHTLNIVVYAPSYRTDWLGTGSTQLAIGTWRLAELAIWDYDSGNADAVMPPEMEKLVGEVVKRLPSVRMANSRAVCQ
ncbi:hypothetical protein C8F01DRAFT_1101754 [Mycena amicta]|nr:hypothetical protein C8F01DRAFT_1101754 [Mycena amicta]